ncbi:MAG: segregation/condensation protein A [Myxococcota bacterium]
MSEGQQDPAGTPAPADGAEGTTSAVGSVAGLNLGAPATDETAEPARVCEVSLDEFEGPLDLLLHLVRRHELDILDIPIAFVCEKYLEYIEFMRAMELEVAGDYLVMAATLAYLKSRELVPQHEEEAEPGVEEDGPDPREQLIARLLEFQKFKDAAQQLDNRPMSGRDTFGRGQEVELPPVDAGLAPITLFRLADAYQRVLDRARIHKSHEVVMETISVAARMNQLTSMLIERGRFDFENIFLEHKWSSEGELRSMLVVTLMSVLELVRMGIASVRQDLGKDAIIVERVAEADAAKAALADYDEAASFGTAKSKGEGEGKDEGEGEGEGQGDSEEAAAAESQPEPMSEVVDAALEPEEMSAEAANDVGGEPLRTADDGDFSLEPTGDEAPASREVEGVAEALSGLSTPDSDGAVAEAARELEAVLSGRVEAASDEVLVPDSSEDEHAAVEQTPLDAGSNEFADTDTDRDADDVSAEAGRDEAAEAEPIADEVAAEAGDEDVAPNEPDADERAAKADREAVAEADLDVDEVARVESDADEVAGEAGSDEVAPAASNADEAPVAQPHQVAAAEPDADEFAAEAGSDEVVQAAPHVDDAVEAENGEVAQAEPDAGDSEADEPEWVANDDAIEVVSSDALEPELPADPRPEFEQSASAPLATADVVDDVAVAEPSTVDAIDSAPTEPAAPVVESSVVAEPAAEPADPSEPLAAPTVAGDPEPETAARGPEASEQGGDADADPPAAGSTDPNETLGSSAGASDRSGVSESPPSSAVADGMRGDEATGSTDGDDEEHGENGEAETVEGS